jgi:hypothetical protein
MWLDRHAWLVLLAASVIYLPFSWRHRVRPFVAAHPELAAGYRRLFWGGFAWSCVPWLAMGVGDVVGGVRSLWLFLRPAAGGPFVWAFWAVVFGWVLFTGYWGIRGGGAEALVRHPGFIDFGTKSVRRVKWYFGGFVALGLASNTAALLIANR